MTMFRNAFLFALIALASLALGIPTREEIKATMEKCAKEQGIDLAEVKKSGRDDPKMKCFGACVMKERGHLKEDGTMNVEKAIEHLPPDIPDRDRIVAAIQECGTKKGENDCETAAQIWDCLRDKDALPPRHGPPPPAA